MSLGRLDFLKAAPLTVKKLTVDGLGELFIREMGGHERDDFEATLMDANGKTQTRGMRARLVMLCACDESGERIFTDSDLDAINAKPATMLQKIADAIIDLNGLKPEDVEGN